MNRENLKELLDEKLEKYNHPSFILNDPLSIPHRFRKKQDIEISGFFAAVLAWGNRVTIIKNCNRLMGLMNDSPYDFIINHSVIELKRFETFVHRTFNSTDLLFIIKAFRDFYTEYESLESLFLPPYGEMTIRKGLENFYEKCFSLPYAPERSKKHIATPAKKSACKRLNMYLRWMVRNDGKGVDLGIWTKIHPSQLICPLDVHVLRMANQLGLLSIDKGNWNTAELLTTRLRELDVNDPVKYDLALFGMGIEKSLKLDIFVPVTLS